MTRVKLLVEGQTEEGFVRELLVPHYARMGVYVTPIIVQTSSGYRGGVVSYAKVRPQIVRLCKQDSSATISTMFDLYALPADFPGVKQSRVQLAGADKGVCIEQAMQVDINQPNFLPYIQVHEFEASLFSRVHAFSAWFDDTSGLDDLHAARRSSSPEEINDNPRTAPSKRIQSALKGYQKTLHGPLVSLDIGLDTMRRECPHFNNWLDQLEALVSF